MNVTQDPSGQKHPGRLRRRLGAGVLACGLLLSLLMVLSKWWWCGYSTATRALDIGDGTLYLSHGTLDEFELGEPGFICRRNRGWDKKAQLHTASHWTWWAWGATPAPYSSEDRSKYTVWPVAPAITLLGAGLLLPTFKAAWRTRRDRCPYCGYPRAGLQDGAVCPECGKASL